jgi:hypothetical protein
MLKLYWRARFVPDYLRLLYPNEVNLRLKMHAMRELLKHIAKDHLNVHDWKIKASYNNYSPSFYLSDLEMDRNHRDQSSHL